MNKNRGLIHIYTGDGKGKTTSAVGLGIRACGAGNTVYMIQFLKTSLSNEMNILNKLQPKFEVFRFETDKDFFWNLNDKEKLILKAEVNEAFQFATTAMMEKQCDLLILDEIMGVIKNNLLDVDEIRDALLNKDESVEVVLTGRNAPKELIDVADYVSEINPVKHPYEQGIPAREGIEF